jgi:hypothetical protein
MAVKTTIVDGKGSGNEAKVSEQGFLYTQAAPYPPAGEDTIMTIYREFLTLNNNGTSTDMRVNGSVTKQYFWVNAEPGYDIYITSLSFLIADANATLVQFGAIAALTNGCRLFYQNPEGQINIGTNLRSNFDIVRLCLGNPAFGSGTEAFRGSNVVGASEAFIPVLDFRTFGFKWGLRLLNDTQNRLAFEINDNLTALDALNVVAYGFRRKIV